MYGPLLFGRQENLYLNDRHRLVTGVAGLPPCTRRAPADQAVISKLRSTLTWRNKVERRVRAEYRQSWSRLAVGVKGSVRFGAHPGAMESVAAPARLLVVDDEATILELLSGS